LPTLRWAAFCVACGGVLWWSASKGGGDWNAVVRSSSSPPERIHEDAILGAQPLSSAIETSRTSPSLLDPHVQPTSAVMPPILYASTAIGATGFTVTSVAQSVSPQQTFQWPVRTQGKVVRLIRGDRVTLMGSGAAADKIRVKIVDSEGTREAQVSPAPTQPMDQWSVDVSLAAVGEQTLLISDSQDESPPPRRIVLHAPTDDDQLLRQPVISRTSNNLFRDPTSPIPSPLRVYGDYLKLSGALVLQGTQLDFAVFQKVGETTYEFVDFAVTGFPTNPRQDGIWESELALPQLLADQEGVLLAQASQGVRGLHRYSDATDRKWVNFKIVRTGDNPLEAPTNIAIARSDGSSITAVQNEFLHNNRSVQIKGKMRGDATMLADCRIVLLLNEQRQEIKAIDVNDGSWTANLTVDSSGDFRVQASTLLGKLSGAVSPAITLRIRTTGPQVVQVVSTTPELAEIKVTFDEPIELALPIGQNLNAAFVLADSKNTRAPISATSSSVSENVVTLRYEDVRPDVYQLTVKGAFIKDRFGNKMETDSTTQLFRPIAAESPAISSGITGPTGPNVPFPEYTKPRPIVNGFNPSDHVETRVSRLYYYRDAHRVAQIVNRDVKSYNRAAVDMQQQLANKSRQIADQATDDRRGKERASVEAAKKTREAERELQEAESRAASAANQAANATVDQQRLDQRLLTLPEDYPDRASLQAQADHTQNVRAQLERVAESARRTAESVYQKVQTLRTAEAAASEQWQASIAVEDRAREEQFRREVAAAHADPDTYAPGKPGSEDPVRQVSVSVIGEGLIQLRGPIKGINVIRTMINQIDAPVGQVRVNVHTVQINGEKGDRMELVAGKIQRYIDHSRFLTLQSAEMLRKAIVLVAAQRAIEAGECAGLPQEERDRRYLYSFFGQDFIRELEVMDSEFLKTGNKLLSIHSMDTTSLASALFIMALAKNGTRLEILQTFEGMMAGELPLAEQSYFEAGLTCDGKHRLFDRYCKREDFQLLSGNARFQSIRGLFDAEIAVDDTMTPIQREFVRLAQIFKSRLIVEMELKQRIMERAVIEERLSDREEDLRKAKQKEDDARDVLERSGGTLRDSQKGVLLSAIKLQASVKRMQETARTAHDQAQAALALFQPQTLVKLLIDSSASADYDDIMLELNANDQANLRQLMASDKLTKVLLSEPVDVASRLREFSNQQLEFVANALTDRGIQWDAKAPLTLRLPTARGQVEIVIDDKNQIKITKNRQALQDDLNQFVLRSSEIRRDLARFQLDQFHQVVFDRANATLATIEAKQQVENELLNNWARITNVLTDYVQVAKYVMKQLGSLTERANTLVQYMSKDQLDVGQAYEYWVSLNKSISELTDISFQTEAGLEPASNAFEKLLTANLDYQFALREAEAARRPLDHKKFLDMLVDEMEDKFIELLEGTRAHTANIDGYIKRLMTSLDDDFNTQFYYPTFRKVRLASQLWDVQMGQVETTNVLANNRTLAKVSPQATMEFDLPKRNIVIAEAIDGAKAMIDDVGALAQDPTFLAMAKLGSGQPTSSLVPGASGGLATMRNVLPGLSTDTAEAVLGQQGPGGAQFGAALEGLIPDPAIYKFESGTGWEIRPVIQPDGQAVVFHFNYMYSTNIREPIRADEKHLGRVKRHFVDTDVQLSNFELREVSRYTVALKAARTARGVPLLEDIPLAGVLFRPLPSAESSLQQNIILSQATIFPTLFDLMGLRWAPVVADLDPLRLSNDEFIVRNRRRMLTNRVFDHSSSEVDRFLRVPESERRMDLYRSQETIPSVHPNGYSGPGANLIDSHLQEGYSPTNQPATQYAPGQSSEGSPLRPQRPLFPPYSLPALDAPQGGSDGDLEAAPSGADVPRHLERPLSQTIGPPVKPLTMSSATKNEEAFRAHPVEGGEVSRTAYLQPVPRTALRHSPLPAPSVEAPLPLRQVELRRLPLVDGNTRSN
jgi:hypothetical protein